MGQAKAFAPSAAPGRARPPDARRGAVFLPASGEIVLISDCTNRKGTKP